MPSDPNRNITAEEFYDTLREVLKIFTQGMMDEEMNTAIEHAKASADARQELFALLVLRELRRKGGTGE
jgi:hypothetical protein